MHFVEQVWLGTERAQTGVGAKEDDPPAIVKARIVVRIGVAEDPPTQGDELFVLIWLRDLSGHVI